MIAGRPSQGKTAFALSIARNAALHKDKKTGVAIFSLEMAEQQLIIRLLAAEAKVNAHELRTGRLHDGDIVVFAAVGSGWTWGAAVFRWSTTSPCSVDGSSRSGEMSRARNPAVVLP